MKTVRKKWILVLLLSSSLLAFASKSADLKGKDSKLSYVSFSKVNQRSVLTIKDQYGITVYKELIKNIGDYTKGFDLTNLPDGRYYFEMDKDLEIEILPFVVTANQVSFLKDEKEIIIKPYVRVKDSKVFVSRISFAQAPISYKVYYSDETVPLFKEYVEGQTYMKKAFDFSKAEKGLYRFVFKSDDRVYRQNIRL